MQFVPDFLISWDAVSPDGEGVSKRRRTAARGRDYIVRIEFAAKIRMRAIEEMMRGAMGRGDAEQEKRALDALRVLDIVLRESASSRYVSVFMWTSILLVFL